MFHPATDIEALLSDASDAYLSRIVRRAQLDPGFVSFEVFSAVRAEQDRRAEERTALLQLGPLVAVEFDEELELYA